MEKIIPVILCGGSGTRLWPLSRKKTPKQFLKLMDSYSLLQRTAIRATNILNAPSSDLVIVTLNALHADTELQLMEVFPEVTPHIIMEPQARNTAAAVALAIQYVEHNFGPDALMWILPADHYVGDEACLKQSVFDACDAARDGYMVTFGIEPTRAETGYGYIRKDSSLDSINGYTVREFIEKPDREIAEQLVASGEYLWSSGMHLFQVKYAHQYFSALAGETWDTVRSAITHAPDMRSPALAQYVQAREEPFETAVMEKADKIAVIPCNPQWSDIGSWESLWEIMQKDENGNALTGDVCCEGLSNSMVIAHDRLVTCVGLKDIIVIETGDSILVADKKSNSGLKALVGTLQSKKREEAVSSHARLYQWGSVREVSSTPDAILREVVIRPNQTYSRGHSEQSSQWFVASGTVAFRVDGATRQHTRNESVHIEKNSFCDLKNIGPDSVRLFEVEYRDAANRNTALPHPDLFVVGAKRQDALAV